MENRRCLEETMMLNFYNFLSSAASASIIHFFRDDEMTEWSKRLTFSGEVVLGVIFAFYALIFDTC